MTEYERIAQECIEACGGLDNVQAISQCVTRFRVVVKDESKVDDDKIKSIDRVKGLVFGAGQHQIIFGPGVVNKVYKAAEELCEKSGISNGDIAKGGSPIQKISRLFGDIFIPVLPAIISAGMLSGIRSFLNYLQLVDTASSWWTILTILCTTVFDMMPVLVTWSACRKFKGTPALGIVLGLMLVSGSLPAGGAVAKGQAEPLMVNLFGLKLGIAGFQGSVLVALCAGWLLATLENFLRDKVVPNIVDQIFTPLLAVALTFLIVMFGCGPIIRTVEHFLVSTYTKLIFLPFGIGGFIIAFLQQFIVITGCHQALNIIDIDFLANASTSHPNMNPMSIMRSTAVFGQCGACAAFIFKAKNAQDKASAVSNTLAASMGITEPAIFAQTLPSKGMIAFICGAIGGGLGGMYGRIVDIWGSGMGVFAIPGITLFLSGGPGVVAQYCIACGITLAVSFGLTFVALTRIDKKETKEA